MLPVGSGASISEQTGSNIEEVIQHQMEVFAGAEKFVAVAYCSAMEAKKNEKKNKKIKINKTHFPEPPALFFPILFLSSCSIRL